MGHDYERDTRRYYQDDDLARRYRAAYTGLRPTALAGLWVAGRERAAVSRMLARIPHQTVLDLPAGTGKLAPVLAGLGSRVTACDVSPSMLELAREEYRRAGVDQAQLQVCDAEQITATLGERFDATVCLRLLHLVPPDHQRTILGELARSADHVVASFGVDSTYQRVRRRLRARLLGADPRGTHCHEPLSDIRGRLGMYFEILECKWISPGLSAEVAFLLRPRARPLPVQRLEFLGLPGVGKTNLARRTRMRLEAAGTPCAPPDPWLEPEASLRPVKKMWRAARAALDAPEWATAVLRAVRGVSPPEAATLAIHWLAYRASQPGPGLPVLDQGLAQTGWATLAAGSRAELSALLEPCFKDPVLVVRVTGEVRRQGPSPGLVAGRWSAHDGTAAMERLSAVLERQEVTLLTVDNSDPEAAVTKILSALGM